MGDAPFGILPDRDDIAAGGQQAIQSAGRSDEVLAAFGDQHRVNHCIHGRIRHASQIARAFLIRTCAPPIEILFIAGAERHGPAEERQVKIKGTLAFDELGAVHHISGESDAKTLQGAGVDFDDRPHFAFAEVAGRQKHLQLQRFAARIAHDTVNNGPARFCHQLGCGPEVLAIAFAAIAFGKAVAFHHAGNQRVRERGEQIRDLPLSRAGLHRKIGVREVGRDTGLGAASQGLVHIFKVEGEDQRFADAPVTQRGAAGVEAKTGHPRWLAIGHQGLDDIAICDRGEIIGAIPFGGIEFADRRNLARLEGLEQHGLVAVEIQPDFVKIVGPPTERQVIAPIVLVPFEGDVTARLKASDHIGARSDWGLVQTGVGKVLCCPLRFLQDGAQARDQGQFPVFLVEGDAQAAFARLFNAVDLVPEPAIADMTFGAERFIGPQDILNRDWRAVRESGLWPQGEFNPGAIIWHLDRLGQEAIEGESLILRASHQAFIAPEPHLPGRRAFLCKGVQRVKASGVAKHHGAALGGIRVCVG